MGWAPVELAGRWVAVLGKDLSEVTGNLPSKGTLAHLPCMSNRHVRRSAPRCACRRINICVIASSFIRGVVRRILPDCCPARAPFAPDEAIQTSAT
eukprot:scaffold47574_cov28-Tisochrysis_lutea.AAC.2